MPIFKRILLGYLLCLSLSTWAAPIIDQWPVIAEAFFKGRAVTQDSGQISITAPSQAEDATLVPISIQLAPAHGFSKWYLFVDANPILLTLTTQMPDTIHSFTLSTRIRLEANSKVRVVAEQPDGTLSMAVVEVKTPGGGCGGAVGQDETTLRANAGKMKLQQSEDKQTTTLQINHPMRTGFERTVYGYYAKAWFLQTVEWQQAGNILMALQLGPGISANPYFRMEYPIALQALAIQASDNEGQQFSFNKPAVSRP
jgi:sulfur-oxidizing protein SoxY